MMTVIVAVDLSSATASLLAAVKRFPGRGGHKVFVVHVAEPDPDFVGWEAGPDAVRDQMASQYQKERRDVEAMAATLRADGLDAAGLVIPGPTVDTVIDEIERRGADLVVVGSHGHGATYDLVVGSVSAGVIRKATVPVLVVPQR